MSPRGRLYGGTQPPPFLPEQTEDQYLEAHAQGFKDGLALVEQERAQALRFLNSYCEAGDPDPRADDGEEISVRDAYVLSAISVLASAGKEGM